MLYISRRRRRPTYRTVLRLKVIDPQCVLFLVQCLVFAPFVCHVLCLLSICIPCAFYMFLYVCFICVSVEF